MAEVAKITNETEREEGEVLNASELIFVDMMAMGKTIQASAEKAGFSYMTGRRYSRRPEIRHAIRERAKEAVHAGALTLSRGAADASAALVLMSRDKDEANMPQIVACKAVIEFSLKVIEIDGMAERLEAVEAQLAANAKAGTT